MQDIWMNLELVPERTSSHSLSILMSTTYLPS